MLTRLARGLDEFFILIPQQVRDSIILEKQEALSRHGVSFGIFLFCKKYTKWLLSTVVLVLSFRVISGGD